MNPISESIIDNMQPGARARLSAIHPHGALYARKDVAGQVRFSWRWTFNGKEDNEPIGLWDRAADPRKLEATPEGFTIRAAHRQAQEWALEHERFAHLGGFRFALQQLQHEQAKQAVREAHHTLGHLLTDYVDLLASRGQHDTSLDVRSIFRVHVERKHAAIWNMPAVQVTSTEVVKLLTEVNVGGVYRRVSSKLRAYMQAAYNEARNSMLDTTMPAHWRGYAIQHNPVAAVPNPKPPRQQAPRALPRALDDRTLQLYWSLISKVPGRKGAALRFHLLTGGQRPAQLVRLKAEEVTSDGIKLYDSKGRGGVRLHVVPLTQLAEKALKDVYSGGKYVMSTDGGDTQLSRCTLNDWAQEVVGQAIPDFSLKLVRSAVESVLSKWRVDKESRGRLQSHGFGGVQDVNYNAFDFNDVKLEALELLEAVAMGLVQKPAVHPEVQRLRQQREEAMRASQWQAAIPPEVMALR